MLLRAGARVDLPDGNGNTPLWRAVFASEGRGELIRLLRDAGADPFRPNLHGRTPLGLARLIGNYDVEQHFAELRHLNPDGTPRDGG